MTGWFALSFLSLGNEHKAEADVVGGDGSRALCRVLAEQPAVYRAGLLNQPSCRVVCHPLQTEVLQPAYSSRPTLGDAGGISWLLRSGCCRLNSSRLCHCCRST